MADDSPNASSEPDAPVLETAEYAFERGDWHGARAIARGELGSSDEKRRAAARQMLDRFRPDGQVVVMYLGAVIFFVLAVWGYILRR